jgi:hypothetical protein
MTTGDANVANGIDEILSNALPASVFLNAERHVPRFESIKPSIPH